MAGIRKKLKAIKNRLRRMVSKTPKRKFYYGFFSKYCRLRPKWVLIESFHGQTVSDSGLVLAQEIARLYPGQYRVFYATEDKKKHQAFVGRGGTASGAGGCDHLSLYPHFGLRPAYFFQCVAAHLLH